MSPLIKWWPPTWLNEYIYVRPHNTQRCVLDRDINLGIPLLRNISAGKLI